MKKFLARLNIEHFRRRLDKETDKIERQVLLRLIAKEEAKLADLLKAKEKSG